MSSYIDTPPSFRWYAGQPLEYGGFSWGAHTFDRLAWIYGPAQAQVIRGGRDPATQADLGAWNRLGRKVAA